MTARTVVLTGQQAADPERGIAVDMPLGIDSVLAERGARYGSFDEHARITQAMKDVARSGRSWSQMTPAQREAVEMILHKLGRIVNGDPDYLDSWTDVIGYTKLVADALESQ